MHSPEKLEIIHLQDSYTIMYALLSRSISQRNILENSSFARGVVVCVVVAKRRCRNVRLHESPAKALRPSGTQ